MASKKFFRLSFFIVATVALTSTPFVHGALGLPMGLEPLPDPFQQTAEPNTAKGLQLAIKQKLMLPAYQSQLDYAKKLLTDAEAKGQTELTDDDKSTNDGRITNIEFTIQRLNAQIEKCNKAMKRNQAIIKKGMRLHCDFTTRTVVRAMRNLADQEIEYTDKQNKEKPNAEILNTLSAQIQTNRRTISDGLRKGIYPSSLNRSNVLLTAIETNNELVTQYLLEKYPKTWAHYDPMLLAQALKKTAAHVGIAKRLLRTYKLNYQRDINGEYTLEYMLLMRDLDSYTDGRTLAIIMSDFHIDPNEMLEGCFLQRNFTFLREILEARADANHKDSYGETPLHRIIRSYKQNPIVLQRFLQYAAKVNVNVQNKYGPTPLDVVSQCALNFQYELHNHINSTASIDLENKIQSAVLLIQAGANKILPNHRLCDCTQNNRRDLFNQIFEAYETKATKITELQRRASDLLIEAAKKKKLSNEMNNRK